MNDINSKLGTPLKAQHKLGRKEKQPSNLWHPDSNHVRLWVHMLKMSIYLIVHFNHVFFALLFLFSSQSHLSDLYSRCAVHCIPSYHPFSDPTRPPFKIFTDNLCRWWYFTNEKQGENSLCHWNSGNKTLVAFQLQRLSNRYPELYRVTWKL